MLDNLITLYACMSPLWDYVLFILFALMFIVYVPCIVWNIIDWKR